MVMEEQLRMIQIAKTINSLSNIPVRLYQGNNEIASFSKENFAPDPITLHLDDILRQPDFVNLYATKNFLFYGTVKQGAYSFILGPVGRIRLDDYSLTEILFLLNQPRTRLGELKIYFESIPGNIEIMQFAEILCNINSCLNEVLITPYEIVIFRPDSEKTFQGVYSDLQSNLHDIQDANFSSQTEEYNTRNIYRSYEFEKNMLHYIAHGEIDNLKKMVGDPHTHAVKTGQLAHDNIRQMKNEDICLAVLASRAAIKGGLDVELSYTLCNIYIQKIEKAYLFNELAELSMQIFYDYTMRVHKLQNGEGNSPVVDRAIRYISRNINQRIFAEDIASHLKVNRSYLSVKFKKETGMTITDYIMKQKIVEAQRLLQFTDKSLLQISNYLDFSSQSYFQAQFKKYTGLTPHQYRQRGKAE